MRGRKGIAERVVEEIKTRYQNPYRNWDNIGGQLIPEQVLAELIRNVIEKRISSWEQLHEAYDAAWKEYPEQRTGHALRCLLYSYGRKSEELTPAFVRQVLQESVEIAKELLDRAYESRKKDYTNPFRRATFRNPEEMEAVWGKLEDMLPAVFLAGIFALCKEVAECLSAIS